jgi:hypothetical protein
VLRPADIGHLLLSFIPREPDRIDTTRLRQLLAQQGVERTPRAIQEKLHALCGDHPIRCIAKSKPYQWQWLKSAPSYEFPPMNAHTALTLKLAYDYLAELLPVSTLAHLKAQARRAEEVVGWRVAVDRPFAGALVPMRFYRKDLRVRAVMIEVRRGSYMDERSGERLPGFDDVREQVSRVLGILAAVGTSR